jgi:hypothetical protein
LYFAGTKTIEMVGILMEMEKYYVNYRKTYLLNMRFY